ncbi:hypothetical protein NE237_033232 [Protea cynaroides]|uniref:Uncharacterized protein n=1 Tax=Protea cynaroides TaxID=273540 RepID=A0A9Q0R4L3_9MAGN|nr:hypothetical protein NE237_033232 [Protea cynaroides]
MTNLGCYLGFPNEETNPMAFVLHSVGVEDPVRVQLVGRGDMANLGASKNMKQQEDGIPRLERNPRVDLGGFLGLPNEETMHVIVGGVAMPAEIRKVMVGCNGIQVETEPSRQMWSEMMVGMVPKSNNPLKKTVGLKSFHPKYSRAVETGPGESSNAHLV